MVTFVCGVGVAIFIGPIYGLICLAFYPVIFLTIALFGKQLKKANMKKIEMSSQLGSIVEESLSAIKLIVSFAQEEKSMKIFSEIAGKAGKVAHSTELLTSTLSTLIRLEIYFYYAYALWVGAHFIITKRDNERTDKDYTVGQILTC